MYRIIPAINKQNYEKSDGRPSGNIGQLHEGDTRWLSSLCAQWLQEAHPTKFSLTDAENSLGISYLWLQNKPPQNLLS